MKIVIYIDSTQHIKPWFQRFKTFGQFTTTQFGALGVFVKIDHSFKKKSVYG